MMGKEKIKQIFSFILFLSILAIPIKSQDSDPKVTEAIFYGGYGNLFSYNHGYNSLLDITNFDKTKFSSSHNVFFGVLGEPKDIHNFFIGAEISFIFNNSEIRFNDSIVISYPPIGINLSIPILYSIRLGDISVFNWFHFGESIYISPTIKPGFIFGGISIENEKNHIGEEENINDYLLDLRQKSYAVNSYGVSVFLGVGIEYVYVVQSYLGGYINDKSGRTNGKNFYDRRANIRHNPCIGLEFGFATSAVSWSASNGSGITDLSNYLFKGFIVNAYLKF
jgi:hypothetical protein